MTWMDKRNYSQVTKYRYGSVYLFPLNIILPLTKRREVANYLTALDWKSKSQECIMDLADRCFKSMSSKLDHNELVFFIRFFFFNIELRRNYDFAFQHIDF